MKRKIVIVSPAYPYRGGQALVESYLFQTLTNAGYDCYTVTFSLLYPKLLFPGKTQYDKSKKVIFEHEDKTFRIINSINPFSWFKAAQKINSLQPDVTVFVWWMPFFGMAYATMVKLIKWGSKSKIVFLVENYISHEKRWFDPFLSKISLNKADAFICQSQFILNQIQKHFKNKPIFKTTLSVYDGYNTGQFNQHSAKEFLQIHSKKTILFFGLIRKYKGLDKLIQSIKWVEKKFPSLTLLIVGECYESIEVYQKLIRDEQLENKTILINKFIKTEEVEPYFKASDLVCLPYNTATQSGILMMAYGFHKPVVVNDVGGLSELVKEGKTGTVIENNTPQKIAEGIMKILENRENEDFKHNIKTLNQQLGYGNVGDIFDNFLD